MIFSKKLRKTAACVLALVMVLAMSTGAFAATGTYNTYITEGASLEVTAKDGYYNLTVNYAVVDSTLPENAQISIIALSGFDAEDDVDDVIVTYPENDKSNPDNVLWIDQYDAAQTSGSVEVTVKETDELKTAGGFWIKSGITGGNTMAAWVAIKEGTTGGEGGEGGEGGDDDDDEPVVPPAETYMVLYGDLNGDGYINGVDGTAMARYLGTVISQFTTADGRVLKDKVADLNGDGYINGVDGTAMARYLGTVISQFTTADGMVLDKFDNNAE